MRIKRLEISGFKSFADQTILHFDQGVTGIVGPNGCGKSNVVDALRWVMGEQNAKSLRGDQMQDIIFNGSQRRGPTGLAQVILTLENDGQNVPPEYLHFSEIQITRRLYRSGDSEYEINRQTCRLRDIVELFLGTGVGTKAYSIIEQGRVSQLVQSKPEERRQVIEEAAGITKYKAKRILAEKRMEATEQNLSRVNDIVKEVDVRLGQLERQAQKAERFEKLKVEFTELEKQQIALRCLRLLTQARFLESQESTFVQTADQSFADVQQFEQSIEIERDSLKEHERTVSMTQGLLYETENAIGLSRQDLAFAEQTLTQHAKQSIQVQEEISRLQEKLRETALLREQQSLERQQTGQNIEVLSVRSNELNTKLSQVQGERNKQVQTLNELQQNVTKAATNATKAQGDIRAAEQQHQSANTRLSSLNQEKQTLLNQSAEYQSITERLQAEIESSTLSQITLQNTHREQSQKLGELEQQLKLKESDRLKLLGEESKGNSRLESLEGIASRHEWGGSAVARMLKHHAASIIGVVADFIEVETPFEALVEKVLHHRLETIVVSDKSSLQTILEDLHQNPTGQVQLLCSLIPIQRAQPGFGVPLLQHIKTSPDKQDLANSLFGSTVIVETDEEALNHREHAQALGLVLVSKSGSVWTPDGTILAGFGTNKHGALALKREIKELKDNKTTLTQQLTTLDTERAQLKEQIEALRLQTNSLRQELQQQEIGIAKATESLKLKSTELVRLKTKSEQLEIEREASQKIVDAHQGQVTVFHQAWSDALAQHQQLEQALAQHRVQAQAIETQAIQTNEEATTLRVSVAQSRERLQGLEQALKQHQVNEIEFTHRIESLNEQIKVSQTEQSGLIDRKQIVTEKLNKALAEKEAIQKNLSLHKQSYESKASQVRELEQNLGQLRRKLEQARQELQTLALALQENRLATKALNDRAQEKYRCFANAFVSEFHMTYAQDDLLTKRLSELKRSMESMGAINPNAVDEYRELKARHTFLQSQVNDLSQALNELTSAISKINTSTMQRFKEAFDAINERFSFVFPKLFRGGKAWLELTNPNDLLTSGVEIFAQPPGKKLASIALMSGGEKALTATSLIFAIFLIKPSPFCLLDEVDAPLDEANVDRFGQMVKEMSKISQFIVITHNKRTMEVADQLYGVTMQEPGCSKTVGVRVNPTEAKLPLVDKEIQIEA